MVTGVQTCALPISTDLLPGYGVGIRSASLSAESIAAAFRKMPVPVIAGIRDEQVIIHIRTLLDGDELHIVSAFAGIFDMGGA
jgi:hypothetical protein